MSDLEEPLGHRYFYASDAPFPKGQKVVRTDHMRVSYVSVSFTSPIEAGASAVSSRVRRLRALEHLLSFKRVLFFCAYTLGLLAFFSDSEDTMPADIRSFFGGKSSQGSASSPAKPPEKIEVRCYSNVHYFIANMTLEF